MNRVTTQDSLSRWTTDIKAFFQRIEVEALSDGWASEWKEIPLSDEALGLGVSIPYQAPLLILRTPNGSGESRVTFEPRHRFTMGAAGRIDVYSHPTLREAVLLRIADVRDAAKLTMEEAEERASVAPWLAYSADQVPLAFDLQLGTGVRGFLSALSDPLGR